MEAAFWQAFRNLALSRGQSLNALAAEIDAARPPEVGLASAIRVHLLQEALSRSDR